MGVSLGTKCKQLKWEAADFLKIQVTYYQSIKIVENLVINCRVWLLIN